MELLIDTGALVDVLTTNVFLKNWPNIKINGAKRDIDDLKNVLLLIVGANRERIFEIDKKKFGLFSDCCEAKWSYSTLCGSVKII